MKITLLITTLFISAGQIFGQGIKIVASSDLTTDLSGTTVEVVGNKDDGAIYYEFRVINDNASTINVKYLRKRDVNSGRLDQICESNGCYDADDTYSYISPFLNSINSGDTSTFKPQIVPNGSESCAVHKYYVLNDFGIIYDSINVIFKTTNANCNLSINNNEKETVFNIYPNPAQDFVTVRGADLKNGGTVVFLDALGKEVKRASVKSASNSISVSELKRGVYFVNIHGQNGAKSNIQRLIIQ